MTATLASSSGFGIGWRPIRLMQPAAKRKVAASMMNAQVRPTVLASRPAAANPMAVEPNEAIDRNEFAAASSSSLAISGIRLSCAGSKNCLIPGIEKEQEVQAGEGDRVDPDDDCDEPDHDGLDEAGPDHDPLPVVTIDVDAGEEPDDEARDRGDHESQADRQGRLGLPPDIDPGRQVGQSASPPSRPAGRARGGRNRAGGRPRTWTGRRQRRRSSNLLGGAPAGVARSLAVSGGERDAFAPEQVALHRQALLAAAPAVASVAADRRRPRR